MSNGGLVVLLDEGAGGAGSTDAERVRDLGDAVAFGTHPNCGLDSFGSHDGRAAADSSVAAGVGCTTGVVS